MASVTFDQVTKRFGDVIAVNELMLEVPDKEFLVLVGPSGCGKTTALRMLAGLEQISDGEIYIGETPVKNVPARERDIAMVFQSYALYPHMSVYDNMAFALSVRKVPKAEMDERVKTAARILDIENLLARKPGALSGGQRQRVALGRAIVRDPAVFLMDEPLSNLDAKLRVQTRAELIRLHERLQTTVIYVTHDQVEAMTMGSHIAVLNFGVLQQFDTPQALYNKPANAFVAGFIGSPAMNFFDAEIVEADGAIRCKIEDLFLKVDEQHEQTLAKQIGKPIVFGIRPEHLLDRRLAPDSPTDAVARTTVDVVEPLGNETFLYLKLTLATAQPAIVARIGPDADVQPQQEFEVAFDMRKAHVFDKINGGVIV